jgi:hypothetical protein
MFIYNNTVGTPRYLPFLTKFLGSVYTRLYMYRDRLNRSDIGSSPALEFIKSLITDLAEPRMLTGDMFDVYMEDILSEASRASKKFDSVLSGANIKTNVFLQGNAREYLVPTNGIIGSKVTVLDGWDKWSDVQVIRMVACNSMELNLDSYKSQLVYLKDKPSYAVIVIDTAALMVKYLVYLRHHKLGFYNFQQDEFIVKYVLSDLYTDMVDVWTANWMLDLLDGKTLDTNLLSPIVGVSEFLNAEAELLQLLDKYLNGSIKLGDILKTKLFVDKSIDDMFYLYDVVHANIPSNRYIGMQLIKISKLASLVMALLARNSYRKADTRLVRRIVVDLDILSRKNWETHIRDRRMIQDVQALLLRADDIKKIL